METADQAALDGIAAALRVVAEPDLWQAALPELRAVAEQMRRGEPVELLDETLVRAGALPAQVGTLIFRIDAWFDRLVARGAELSEATRAAPEGRRMRKLAQQALAELGYLPRGQHRRT